MTEDLGLALADVFTEKNLEEIGGSPGVVFVTSNICKLSSLGYSLLHKLVMV